MNPNTLSSRLWRYMLESLGLQLDLQHCLISKPWKLEFGRMQRCAACFQLASPILNRLYLLICSPTHLGHMTRLLTDAKDYIVTQLFTDSSTKDLLGYLI